MGSYNLPSTLLPPPSLGKFDLRQFFIVVHEKYFLSSFHLSVQDSLGISTEQI